MEVVVFGAGSLGSLVGGLLARIHDVTLVGRDPHVSAVRTAGLRVRGRADFDVTPTGRTDGRGLSGDLAVVTVKSFDTETIAGDIATGEFEAVLSLQNGMGNEQILADRLDGPIVAGVTSHGAVLTEPGVVEWTGEGDTAIGPWRPPDRDVSARVAETFDSADVPVTVETPIERILWEKLAVNAAINPVTALARIRNGALFAGPTAELADTAARETARTARAEGIDLSDRRALERTRTVAEETGQNRSSMYQDVRAGRRTEIESITGYVLARAEEHGLAVPVSRTLCGLVRGWEHGQGLR